DAPVPPPGADSSDVFFYNATPGVPIDALGPEFDIALAGPVTAPFPFPPPDPQGGPVQGVAFVGPDPHANITFDRFEAGIGNQIASGPPYPAQITPELTQTLSDGNKIERKPVTSVYRDGQGRTRREQTLPAIGQYSANNGVPKAIFINDP